MKRVAEITLRFLTKNIGVKLLSLFLAVVIWLVVVSIDNPLKDQTFTQIPVTVLNGQIFEEAGQAYELSENSQTVSVTVRAERTVLAQLSRDDFTASADLNNYSNGRVPITVKANRLADRITSITPRTAYATVHVEELGTKQFSIDYEITGEPGEGYSVGDVVLANNVVRVQGPESIVNNIDRALVRVSTQGMTRDMRTEAQIIFTDHNGDEVDTSALELSRSSVSVTVEIWEDKEVNVTYSYTGTPAEGFSATGKIMATINSLTVSGDPEILDELTTINVPAEELDITGATESVIKTIDLSTYLPSGARPADENTDTVSTITVEIVAMNLLNVEVPVANITISNIPEGFTVGIGDGTATVATSVRGLADVLATVNGAMLTGHIDMNEVKSKNGITEWTTGLYDADVTFAYPEGVYGSGVTTTVKVFVQDNSLIPVPAEGEGHPAEPEAAAE